MSLFFIFFPFDFENNEGNTLLKKIPFFLEIKKIVWIKFDNIDLILKTRVYDIIV